MPFQFEWLCNLLEELQRNRHKATFTTAKVQNHEQTIIYSWYQRYSHRIDRTGPSAIAFLSCLLPERRPDRVYNLQAKRLSQVFGRALGLGAGRAAALNEWRNRDGADFPTCVERVLKGCENDRPRPGKEVTLEEIDEVLDLLAANALSSSPAIRSKTTNKNPTELLTPILRRLKSNEAKWFARMLLKSYTPVQIPEYQALHGFHFMLPNLLRIQNSFAAATATLAKEAICQLPSRPEKNFEHALIPLLAEHVQPYLGVMIQRQPYFKARSIKNCCDLAGGRLMSIERKYDGEYCQVHVDISKGQDCIQLFSKSGKDSTNDRIHLHNAIKDALRIGRNGCLIRRQCIIEGELLVWNASQKQIQPFHKIRKYVKHGGREIGTAQDSPPMADEHLMIVFYDLLVLDDRMLLKESQKIRRQYLKTVVQTIEGRAILCERQIIDFRSKRANEKLRDTFAHSITQHWEGLVLKSLSEPYFSWKTQSHGIKMKKDYIRGLGDSADLCIVGGRRDPQAELQIGLGSLQWTSFYVGAVCNMETMRRFDTKPKVKVIDVLTHHSMPNSELLDLNKLGQLVQVDYSLTIPEFDVEMGRFDIDKPTHLFKKPFIVEIMGAGFEKPSNSSFYTLRFPRKTDGKVKLHTDRSLLETMSFAELQHIAENSFETLEDQDSQEDAAWIERLIKADGKNRQANSFSQQTNSEKTPVSASAISLSPITQDRKKSDHIFIRPDTVEPETQITIEDTAGMSSQIESSDQVSNCTRLSGPQNDSRVHSNSLKRTRKVLQNTNQTEPPNKRHCEKSHSPRNNNSEVQETVELTMDQKTQERKKGTINIDNGALDSSQLRALAFNPPAEFYTPAPSEIEASIATDAQNYSIPTPDSTLLMRQLMFMHDQQEHSLVKFSPIKTFSGRPTVTFSTSPQQAANTRPNTCPAVLPTPPSSSPLIANQIHKRQQHLRSPILTMSETPLKTTDEPPPTAIKPSAMDTAASQPPINQVTDINPSTSSLSPILILNVPSLLELQLADVDVTFTLSSKHFLDQVEASINDPAKARYSVVVIDVDKPSTAADGFKALARRTQSRLQSHDTLHNPTVSSSQESDGDDKRLDELLSRYNDRILVFDKDVFKHENIVDGKFDLSTIQALKYRNGKGRDAALFCGVLRFYTREVVGTSESEKDRLRIGIELEYEFAWTRFRVDSGENRDGGGLNLNLNEGREVFL